VVVVSPWVWLIVRLWKPLLVFAVLLWVLVLLSLPVLHQVAVDEAARQAAVPTMYIPQVWRDALTQAAARPTRKAQP